MPVKVKICGITNLEDARAAEVAGADAIGFIFYEKSPRFISIDEAARIRRFINPFVHVVGVFVDHPYTFIRDVVERVELDFVQLHGNEPPELCRLFGEKVIKAFRVKNDFSLETCKKYPNTVWLLDTYSPAAHGGTGATFDWKIAVEAKSLNPNLILSGGLNPDNVGEAIRLVRPLAVDVSSGVEISPGKKDKDKIKKFVRAAKLAALELLDQVQVV